MHPRRLVDGGIIVGAARLEEQDRDVTVDEPAGQRAAGRAGAHDDHVSGEISQRPHTGVTLSEPPTPLDGGRADDRVRGVAVIPRSNKVGLGWLRQRLGNRPAGAVGGLSAC